MQQKTEGSLLKAAREAKGVSLETVHEATKIPMDALRAIEEGYTVRTLSSFYLKGFVKMYAQYLGVNVSEQEGKDQRPKPNVQQPRPIEQRIEEFDLQEWLSKIFTQERLQQVTIFAGIIFILFFLFKIITFFTHRQPKKASLKVEEKLGKEDVVALENIRIEDIMKEKGTPQNKTKATKPIQAIPSEAVYTATKPAVSPSKTVVQKNVMLTVLARKDSWLHVKADEVTVFRSTLSKGATETWTAQEKIEISGRYINQLEFELNGKMIGSLGRKDHYAKKVLVTKDGLSVAE